MPIIVTIDYCVDVRQRLDEVNASVTSGFGRVLKLDIRIYDDFYRNPEVDLQMKQPVVEPTSAI